MMKTIPVEVAVEERESKMSDSNLAVSSDKVTSNSASLSPRKQGAKERSLLGLRGASYIVLLCLSLLACSLLNRAPSTGSSSDKTAVDEAVVSNEKLEPPKTDLVSETRPENEPGDAVANAAGSEADQASAIPAAEISPLTFALATTAEGEPIEPDFSFAAGVTQIHAVFEYAHLSPNLTWTQVWYHDSTEVLSTSQPWLEGETGVFDYLIEAGGGPLPVGQWALEFYIDGELLTAGSFVIEGEDTALAAGEMPDLADIPRIYKLAYTKWNGEKHDLYVGDTNGSREQFIMSRSAGPSWSPDGRYIFFYGEEGVDQQVINGVVYPLPGATNGIVRLNAAPLPASIRQIQLFQGYGWNDGTARSANVSPDGAMIAYDGDRGGGWRIYFLGTEANQQFRYEIIGEQADWSPDSQKIVYRSGRNNQTGIWISNRNDSGHTRITGDGSDSFPVWSPDGKTIAFSRDVGGNVDIYTVNIDGSNLLRLTSAPGHDTLPLYLPNGDIVFRSARTGRWGIWKMSGDGSNQTEIIPNAPVGPEWSYSRMSVLH
jgi:Tol biopolymer transport system component